MVMWLIADVVGLRSVVDSLKEGMSEGVVTVDGRLTGHVVWLDGYVGGCLLVAVIPEEGRSRR